MVKYAHGTRIDPSMYPIFNSLRLIHFQKKTTVVGIAPTKKPWDIGHAFLAPASPSEGAPVATWPLRHRAVHSTGLGVFFEPKASRSSKALQKFQQNPQIVGISMGRMPNKTGS